MRHDMVRAAALALLLIAGLHTSAQSPVSDNENSGRRFDGTVTIAMNGDIMTGSKLPTPELPPNEGRDIFIDCDSIIRSADVACGNLEGVLADNGKTRKRPGRLSFSFMMPSKSVNLLVNAGYDFLGIANNLFG